MAGKWINGKCIPYSKAEVDEDGEAERQRMIRETRFELEELLRTPAPPEPIAALTRTKQCADLLQTIVNSKPTTEMHTSDVVRVLHESFFAIAYKQGVEDGKRQSAKLSDCEVCAERRRRNREAAALARKRQKFEQESDEE